MGGLAPKLAGPTGLRFEAHIQNMWASNGNVERLRKARVPLLESRLLRELSARVWGRLDAAPTEYSIVACRGLGGAEVFSRFLSTSRFADDVPLE